MQYVCSLRIKRITIQQSERKIHCALTVNGTAFSRVLRSQRPLLRDQNDQNGTFLVFRDKIQSFQMIKHDLE